MEDLKQESSCAPFGALQNSAPGPERNHTQLELFGTYLPGWPEPPQPEHERRRYSRLFNLAPIGFLALNEENRILEANVECALLLVNTKEKLIAEDFSRYVWPSDRDLFTAYRKRARFGQKECFELELCTALGRRFSGRLETILTREVKWLVALADVTAYKKSEKDLLNARDELQSVCEKLRDERDQRFQGEEELRRFSQSLMQSQEKERQRIARELYDQVGQQITYLSLLLDKAKSQLDSQLYDHAKSVAQQVLIQIRGLSSDLQPSMLRSIGLVASLEALFERFESMTGIVIKLQFNPQSSNLTGDAALIAYRITQEALTNIARHADVRLAAVDVTALDGILRISIRDEGKGFDEGVKSGHTGLTGMKERAQAIGGSLNIRSSPGQGTVITAELPLSL